MTPRNLLLTATLLLLTPPLSACSLPVFRFALEQWPAAPYNLVVLQRGNLDDTQRQALNTLEEATKIPEAFNATLDVIDLDKPTPRQWLKLIEREKNEKLPRLIALYPESGDDMPPAWRGNLSAEAVNALIDSPKRRELATQLLGGNAFVWVLLESDDAKANEAAAALVASEVEHLKQHLKFPADPNDPPALRANVPLKIAFPLVRVSHADAKEAALIAQFNNMDPDQCDAPGPGVTVVFGRGRALPPLRGKSLNAEILRDMATFVTGECSCKVKELNPGVDLLMRTDWLQIFDGGRAPAAAVSEIPEPILPHPAPAPHPAQDSPKRVAKEMPSWFFLEWSGLGVAALAAAAMWLVRRKK